MHNAHSYNDLNLDPKHRRQVREAKPIQAKPKAMLVSSHLNSARLEPGACADRRPPLLHHHRQHALLALLPAATERVSRWVRTRSARRFSDEDLGSPVLYAAADRLVNDILRLGTEGAPRIGT